MSSSKLSESKPPSRAESPKLSPVVNPDEYIHSSLIHEVYLNNDLKNDFPRFWGRTAFEEGGFGAFFQGIKELAGNIKAITGKRINHSETISELITPVLIALGWGQKQEALQGKNIVATNKLGDEISIKPSFLLFTSSDDANAFFQHYKSTSKPVDQISQIPVATSYFGSWADQKSSRYDQNREQIGKHGDIFSALGTDEQVYNYLDLLNSEWGISTDGHSWRLIKKSAFAVDHNKYFEFNLWGLLNALATAKPHEEDALAEILKSFYWFFSKDSHLLSKPNQISLTWERAKKYTDNLEDDLRARFVAAMSIGVNSIWKAGKQKSIELELNAVQDIAESFIFSTIFIRSCESRRVLPLHQNYLPVSLHNLVSKLRDLSPEDNEIDSSSSARLSSLFGKQISDEGTEIFDYLTNLFDLTTDSEKKSKIFGFAIEGFKEHIFSDSELKIIKKAKIENIGLAKMLSMLFYQGPGVQIPYNILTPQQFGSIFESFLEYKLSNAKVKTYLVKRVRNGKLEIYWDESPKNTDVSLYEAKNGSLYFKSDNGERKISGSYYTPDTVVDFIVMKTLGPILKGRNSKEILDCKVCDPAMGSGHFLISALRFISTHYIKAQGEFLSKAAVKRKILHSCVFGVDKNSRAVKLGKLALWLETAEPGKTLEHLDDQLVCTNSLTDTKLWKTKWNLSNSGFDAIVGNPPYLGQQGNKEIFQEIKATDLGRRFHQRRMDLFYFFFHLGLDILKDNGMLGFVSTSYYMSNTYADKLREDLKTRSTIICLYDLGKINLFKSATGQHNAITILQKGKKEKQMAETCHSSRSGEIDVQTLSRVLNESDKKTSYYKISQRDIYSETNGKIQIEGSGSNDMTGEIEILNKLEGQKVKLIDLCNIDTGVQTGINKVSKSHLEKYEIRANVGDGVFVLSKAEVKNLNLNSDEKELIKPCFKNSDIERWHTSEKASEWMIYYTSKREYKGLPNIKKHLNKFKLLLVNRNVRSGKISLKQYDDFVLGKGSVSYIMIANEMKKGNFYCVSYARNEQNFLGEKIVCRQRAPSNIFGYNEIPWYPTTDIFTITKKDGSTADLTYVLGILNSKLYYLWMYLRGKRKGELLEFAVESLKNIPVIIAEVSIQKEISNLVKKIVNGSKAGKDISALEVQINKRIYELYRLSAGEIKTVEKFYHEHHSKKVSVDSDVADEKNEEAA